MVANHKQTDTNMDHYFIGPAFLRWHFFIIFFLSKQKNECNHSFFSTRKLSNGKWPVEWDLEFVTQPPHHNYFAIFRVQCKFFAIVSNGLLSRFCARLELTTARFENKFKTFMTWTKWYSWAFRSKRGINRLICVLFAELGWFVRPSYAGFALILSRFASWMIQFRMHRRCQLSAKWNPMID